MALFPQNLDVIIFTVVYSIGVKYTLYRSFRKK